MSTTRDPLRVDHSYTVWMSATRTGTIAVLALRVAYGAALAIAPGRVTRRWLGQTADTAGGSVALRGLGARDAALHVGALAAFLRGAPMRPWLGASIAGDVTDIVATAGARKGLPEHAAPATVAVAGASALISAALSALADA